MRILFKFASRSRPEKCFAALDNIFELATSKDFMVLLSIDNDDAKMNQPNILLKLLENYPQNQLFIDFGNSNCKIHAINRGIKEFPFPWDILCNHSDDMRFTRAGFDEKIRDSMAWYFPDTDGFLHFPDGYTEDKLCTYSIMGRTYYSRTNYIYHPAYYSLFCDNEATEVAKLLGKYAFVAQSIIKHEHVANGHGEKDALLKRNERYWNIDKATYHKRKAKNFDI